MNTRRVLRTLVAIIAIVTLALGASAQTQSRRDVTVTFEERQTLHELCEKYRDELIDAMCWAIRYDSISFGGTVDENGVPTFNDPTEYARKTAMFKWAELLSKQLGFPVVYREEGNYVYAEFGDPDAPQMVMALSHLDSPTASINPTNLPRWTSTPWTPRIEGDWLYGCGVQDDSEPTIATLIAAKALMDANFPMDRRVRVVFGGYEDGSPRGGASRGWFDVWRYKQTQEIPIASFTSDSRFPVIYGNSGNWNRAFTYDLSADAGKNWELLKVKLGVDSRTPEDILYGSGVQIPSKATIYLRLPESCTGGNGPDDRERLQVEGLMRMAAFNYGWEQSAFYQDFSTDNEFRCKYLRLTVEGVAQEAPTPHYGKNALVRAMCILSRALPDGLALKKVATDIADFFGEDAYGVEDTGGIRMGCGGNDPRTGYPLVTIALGYSETVSPRDVVPQVKGFTWVFDPETKTFRAPLYARHLYEDPEERDAKSEVFTKAWTDRGWDLSGYVSNTAVSLYTRADSPLVDLLYKSYKNTIQDATGFGPLPEAYPQGTTGGTYAGEFWGKMVAYGAVIPGDERWWHAPNERVSIESAVRQTKFYADAFLELARYSGPAGAKPIKVELPGMTTIADMLLLDVDIGTYKDASAPVPALDGLNVYAATSFSIPILKEARTSGPPAHDVNSGAIYMKLAEDDTNIYVLPQRLEFRLTRPVGMNPGAWEEFRTGGVHKVLERISVMVLQGDTVTDLRDLMPTGTSVADFFSIRAPENSDVLYVSVNLAIQDADTAELAAVSTGASSFFVVGDARRDAVFTSPTAVFVAGNI